jgi:AbrB family looped-hinge helix DNA binding protein
MITLFRITEGINMKISERGQITIPKPLRNKLGLLKSVEIEVIPVKEGLLIQKRSRGKHPVDEVMGILRRPSNTDRYIEEVRGR